MRFVIECWRHVVQFENQIDIKQTNLLLANELFIFWALTNGIVCSKIICIPRELKVKLCMFLVKSFNDHLMSFEWVGLPDARLEFHLFMYFVISK